MANMIVDKFTYQDTILKQLFKIKEKDYCGQLIWKIEYNWKKIWKIDEFSKMESCEQNPKWHGEGNCKKHTILVCESAEKIINNYLSIDEPKGWIKTEEKFDYCLILLTAALFHDIGKIRTTKIGKDGNWHSYNHEYEGEKITRRLLWDTGYEFREAVCALVKYHMIPMNLFDRKDYMEEITRICHAVPSWNLLMRLKACDLEGSIQKDEELKIADYEKIIELEDLGKAIEKHIVPQMKKRKHLYQSHLDSINKKHLDLIVMIGLPGSGKDTFVNSHYNSDKYAIICRDDIRAELGFCEKGDKIVGTSKQEDAVTKYFNDKMLEAAKEGKTIVINNTNLKKEYRVGYTRLLSNYNVHVEYIYIEASTISKNIERRKGQKMGVELFESMIEKFEWPTKDEYDKLTIAKN